MPRGIVIADLQSPLGIDTQGGGVTWPLGVMHAHRPPRQYIDMLPAGREYTEALGQQLFDARQQHLSHPQRQRERLRPGQRVEQRRHRLVRHQPLRQGLQVETTADDKATALTARAHLAQDAADLGQRAARPRQHPAQVVGPFHHHVHAQRGQVFGNDDACHQRHGAHVGQTIGRQLAAQRGGQCMTRLRLPGLASPPPAGRLFTGHQPYRRQRVLTFRQRWATHQLQVGGIQTVMPLHPQTALEAARHVIFRTQGMLGKRDGVHGAGSEIGVAAVRTGSL